MGIGSNAIYFVIMEPVDFYSAASWDTFCGESESKDAAIGIAKEIWSHLTSEEKAKRIIYVAHASGEDAGKCYADLSDRPDFNIDFRLSESLSPSELHVLNNEDLIFLESSLDFSDPGILEEIFSRAELLHPGITQHWKDAVCGDSEDLPDTVKEEAIHVLLMPAKIKQQKRDK